MQSKVIFLDRDGVINQDSAEYIKTVEEFQFIPGSIEAMAALSKHGFVLIVITNQSGIGRGYYTWDTLMAMHHKLEAAIQAQGGQIAGIFVCPHLPTEQCICRKPSTGLVLQAIKTLGVSAQQQPFVGDSERDILCAKACGCQPILVGTGNGAKAHLLHPAIPFYPSLWEYAQTVLQKHPTC